MAALLDRHAPVDRPAGPRRRRCCGRSCPGLADEIIEAISVGVPDYARPLEGPFGEALRAGVEEALRQFVDLVERSDDPSPAPGARST